MQGVLMVHLPATYPQVLEKEMAISTHHGEMCQQHIILTHNMSMGSTCVSCIMYSHLMSGLIRLQVILGNVMMPLEDHQCNAQSTQPISGRIELTSNTYGISRVRVHIEFTTFFEK
jgi:hypothetical protein